MRKPIVAVCSLCIVALVAGGVSAFSIRVAPSTLVLSSAGGSFTIHTSIRYTGQTTSDVSLTIVGVGEVSLGRVFPDDRGNLVAQCSKAAVAAAVKDHVDEKSKTFTVILAVDGAGTGTGDFRVVVGKCK
jgi:hypothetical protein